MAYNEVVDLSGAQVKGNLPVTHLNSGTSASATTFWAGNGTWATPAGSGGTVTSVAGTLNRITSTGGAAPVIDISGSYVGQSTITTLGTVTTGTWSGTTVIVAHGGTGQVTLTNHGVLIGQGTTGIAATAAGTAGQVLQSGGSGADPVYSTATFPATAGTSGNVLTSNGTNWTSSPSAAGTVTSVSGTSARITSTGGATPVIDISGSYVGQSSITTLGTVTTGTWNGTTVDATHGGTAQTSYATGDILYASATNTLSKLSSGANIDGSTLMTDGLGVPFWAYLSSGVINAKTTGAGTIFTTGTNQNMVFTGVIFRCAAATAITVACTISIGTNSTTNNNIMAATALTGLTTVSNSLYIPFTGVIPTVAASTAVGYNITVAATGTSQSITAMLVGRVLV